MDGVGTWLSQQARRQGDEGCIQSAEYEKTAAQDAQACRRTPGEKVIWYLYLLRTRTGALYTGITLDVARRLQEHAGMHGRGAKCLRAMGPLVLEYSVAVGDKGTALTLEHRIKKLGKARKEAIIREQPAIHALLRDTARCKTA